MHSLTAQNTRLPLGGCRQLILQDVNKVECAGGNPGARAVTTASVGSTLNQRISKRHDTAFVGGMGRLHAARQQGEPHKVPLHDDICRECGDWPAGATGVFFGTCHWCGNDNRALMPFDDLETTDFEEEKHYV